MPINKAFQLMFFLMYFLQKKIEKIRLKLLTISPKKYIIRLVQLAGLTCIVPSIVFFYILGYLYRLKKSCRERLS